MNELEPLLVKYRSQMDWKAQGEVGVLYLPFQSCLQHLTPNINAQLKW